MNTTRRFQKHFILKFSKILTQPEVKLLNLKILTHFSSSSTQNNISELNITSYAIKDGQIRQHTQSHV